MCTRAEITVADHFRLFLYKSVLILFVLIGKATADTKVQEGSL